MAMMLVDGELEYQGSVGKMELQQEMADTVY